MCATPRCSAASEPVGLGAALAHGDPRDDGVAAKGAVGVPDRADLGGSCVPRVDQGRKRVLDVGWFRPDVIPCHVREQGKAVDAVELAL